MRLTPPDVTLWLCTYVRAMAAVDGKGVDVADVEPENLSVETLTRPLVVIRDDSGPQNDLVSYDRSIGVSVLHPTKRPALAVNDLARWVAGVLFDLDIVLAEPLVIDDDTTMPCPISAVTLSGCNGPYAVPEELDVARRYLTAEYVVTGSW
jgi:hypothetical protein